ncbi:MAG TPA: 50S ribosomal protein L11 methyltransferase [Vicinamibacterales bacterium]|nr:50S ribosomal protein L11 methyltransferase [Vicinamibacterales bacterium]
MARTYPALDLHWPTPPDADTIDRTLAAIDDDAPTAVEPSPAGMRVFFSSPAMRDRAATRVADLTPAPSLRPIDVPDEDWAARSQASLGPVTVGRIVVAPPWARGPASGSNEIEIVILPSMGFGTGHHASTRLCLRLLQAVRVAGKRVLDVGTGSGVLALAGARLGAGPVLAVDCDPDALASAADNLQLNDMTGLIELRLFDLAADLDHDGGGFDGVLANLTGGLLIRYADQLGRLATPDGFLLVSGFERFEAEAVCAAFAAVGWSQDQRLDEDDWTGLTLTSTPTRPTAR